MITADFHTHTTYSHGKLSVAQVADIAVEKGLHKLAISEHGKGNAFYGVSDRAFARLREDITRQNERMGGKINIFMGIEADFLGNGKCDIPQNIDFDVVLIGYHRGIIPHNRFALSALRQAFSSYTNPEKNTDEVLRTFDNYPNIFAMTHPGEYIRMNLNRLSKEAAKRNILLEINNRHPTFCADDLKLCADNGASFLISSDGHTLQEMCCFGKALALASEADVLCRVVNFK